MRKAANYNVRFCDVVDQNSMRIDLTPAEVKEGLGKILYVIRDVYENDGAVQLNYLYLSNALFEEGMNSVKFIGISGGVLTPLDLVADNDDVKYYMQA